MINMNEKHECEVCGGKYTYRNKSVHSKTKRHLNALTPVVKISKVQKQFNKMTVEEKEEMLKLLNEEVVVDVDDDEKEFEEYLIIREGGVWSPDQLEIYLKHHTKDGEFLTDEEKQFVRDMA
jgi:hypothetical protein